jgi:hypothetical protein
MLDRCRHFYGGVRRFWFERVPRSAEARVEVTMMARMLIRVDAELSDELTSAFPHLIAHRHPASTTLTGDLADQQELQGVLNHLNTLGIDVVEVLTIPED